MFEGISEKLGSILGGVEQKPVLTEEGINSALREVRLSLLEADVNFRVVKDFTDSVRRGALGLEREKGLTAGQQFVKIVNTELTALLGEKNEGFAKKSGSPLLLLLAGLQGAGKTTTCSKLAAHLAKQGAGALLVPADVHRPAAAEQLRTLAAGCGADFYQPRTGATAPQICAEARDFAADKDFGAVIFDTAGRLHIDSGLMDELAEIKKTVVPDEVLLVADAMTGQDAVAVAESFDRSIDITGVVLTKMDGDSRGGAAMSIRAVTGKPIKFFGTGEQADALEVFHPKRIASRILGMGDVLTFVEKAGQAVADEEARAMEKRLLKNRFTLDDFGRTIIALRKMGPIENVISMVPGMGGALSAGASADKAQREMEKNLAIINSMTPKERKNHALLASGSRKKRIALGSGRTVAEVNRMIKSFLKMQSMLKKGSKRAKFM